VYSTGMARRSIAGIGKRGRSRLERGRTLVTVLL
jgi:hypothetical protein